MGLDTDKPETADALLAFVDESPDPVADDQSSAGAAEDAAVGSSGKEGRLLNDDDSRDSNVQFPAAL